MKVGQKRIFVVESAWVIIGTIAEITSTHYHLIDAQVVRRWGTTEGLAQLATSGPTKDTILELASLCSIRKDKELFSLLWTAP